MEMTKGQRISYRVYKTTYGLTVDDSSTTTASVRHGTVHSVNRSPRFVQVRDDASGRVVNVLNHRIVSR